MAVNRYGGLRVATAPLPGVRKSAAETPDSEGAQLDLANAQKDETIGQAIGGPLERLGADAYAKIQDDARKDADNTALLKASNALSDWKNQTLYDPNAGAFTKHGQDALPLPEQVRDSFASKASEIADTLNTPEQKQAWNRIQSQEWQNIDGQVRRHVFGEMQTYKASELKGLITNSTDEAIRSADDPRMVAINLGKVTDAIKANGPQLGLGPEAVTAQVAAAQSDVHVGVIKQLLATEQPTKASAYFDAAKSQIAADRLDDVEKALEVGSTRAAAQKASDDIIAQGGTLTEQMNRAKGLDPKVREEVEQRLSRNDALQERAQREQTEASMRAGYDILDKTGDVTSIPPAVWAGYSGPVRSAMRAYANQRVAGVAVKTDYPTFYGLLQQAANQPETFANTNLLGARAKLSDGDFKHLAEMQVSIKNGDRAKADAQGLDDFRTRDQVLNDTLPQYNIDPKAKPDSDQGKANAELRRLLDQRVDAMQQPDANGKRRKATGVEVQQQLDQILSAQKGTPGSWWAVVPFSGVPLGQFTSSQRRIVDLQIGDVPSDERPKIEAALHAKGLAVSDATVLDLYIRNELRKVGR